MYKYILYNTYLLMSSFSVLFFFFGGEKVIDEGGRGGRAVRAVRKTLVKLVIFFFFPNFGNPLFLADRD